MTDRELLGASVDAVVGTMMTGEPRSSAIALDVSSVLPPPTPMTTSASLFLATSVSRSISASEASPLNSSYLKSISAFLKLSVILSSVIDQTISSDMTNGFPASFPVSSPSVSRTPCPCIYFPGDWNTNLAIGKDLQFYFYAVCIRYISIHSVAMQTFQGHISLKCHF